MAEGEGFEPSIRFPVYTLSRRAPSTTRPPLLLWARRRTTTPAAFFGQTGPDVPHVCAEALV